MQNQLSVFVALALVADFKMATDLRNLIGWVILTVCINYIAGLIWIMNRSRKWLFWRGTIAEIALLLVIQVGFVIFFGVHTTRNAVMLSFPAFVM